MSGNIQQSFAYNGLDFSIIEDCTAVQVAGNAVVLWNTIKNQKEYIWSKKGGYCMATSNYNVSLVACAEYGLDPEVHIYRCAGGGQAPQLQDTFKMDTTVKCIGMAFSRCGKYLLMIGGVPDFRISIYDIESSKKLVIPETKLLCKPEEFLQAKFNPANKSQFVILSQTTLYSYTINPAYDVTETGDQKILGEAFRLEHIEYKDENPDLTFGKLIWDQYGRVHICTDLPIILMVNVKTCQLENTVNLTSRPCSCLLTQKHMLVSLEEGILIWLNLELPEVNLGDKDADQSLKILEEIDQEFSLNLTVGESDIPEYVAHMHYTKSFKTLILGTETGVFGRLDVQAEVINYEEDEEEQNKQKEKKTIEVPFIELGRFHTKRVNGIKELGESTQLITISEDHYMSVWEATTQKLLSTVYQPATPTSIEVATDGSAAFVGTVIGAFRAYDLTNRQRPRLVMQCRFFEEDVPINCISISTDGKYILVSSNEKNIVYILSGNPQERYTIYGFIEFEGVVLNAAFHTDQGKLKVLAVLENNLLAGADVPLQPVANRVVAIPQDQANISYRKIDRHSNRVVTNQQTKDIYITGDDKLLKRYEIPQEKLNQIDYKRAPMAPIEEHFSHSIGTTSYDYNKESKWLATGGRDGNVFLRHTNDIGSEPSPIKAHSIFSGGVTALCFSKTMQMIYTAGGDGSFMIWSYGPNKAYPNQPIEVPIAKNGLEDLPELQRVPANQIKVFSEILKDEFLKQQEGAKAQFKQVLMKDLSGISDKLLALLAENQRVTDIEKLERDEFVIDVNRQIKVNQDGEKECDEIRKEAEKTVQRLMLLRDRVQQSTYDTMLVQQKACKSISSDTLIWNYPIRKRIPVEERRLNQITNIRRMELIERLDKDQEKEKGKLQEALNESDFTAYIEDYLMNRVRGVPDYMDDDSIKLAAEEYLRKEMEKKARREKQQQGEAAGAAGAVAGKGGPGRVPILKITKGKLGTKTKKKDVDEDQPTNQGKKSDFERKEMSEMHWRIIYKLLENEVLLKNLQNGKDFKIRDLLYEPFELYTDVRKRNQIELIKEAVFELKKDFNDKFKELEDSKKNQIENIKEKNKMIEEILENLGQEEEMFVPVAHPLENPQLILNVKESEVKVEKYLTKEERAILEEEQRKAAEREAALKGDNVGRRGLYTMMGGVELIIKKEKGALDMELVREDWMNKPEDEMTDEEKGKLKEFEQKEKEFKEKQRKAWEKDLLKIKQEIEEIHVKFDNELDELFKYKLFVDVRILEQELYFIRLVIMLHDGRETKADEMKYRAEMERIEKEKAKKEEEINTFRGFEQDLDDKVNDDQVVKDQERELRKMFPDANIKQTMAFVRQGKAKKTALPGEVDPRKAQMLAQIVELDPFEKIDKARIEEILANEDQKEKYDFEKDSLPGLNEDDFEKLVQERQIRAEMDKQKQKQQNQITQLQEHISYLEDQLRVLDEKNEGQDLAQKKAAERILKIRYNYEVIVYLKQGLVEVPQLPVATDYKDAVLVSKDVIAYENNEIIHRGNKKVQLMNAISSFKTGLKQVRFQKKRLDLEIKDFEERAKDVQLYRVTKQTQEIIQGKHQKKDEEDKKRLENQIKQLEENAQKRIKNINETKLKLKKEIREKRMESDQLEGRARQLQNNVDQRKQIMSLKSNTMTDGDADPSKKIKEIAHKRKLLDIAKQQTEEIEVLRDELDRLRAKTFPSFAHLHNKPGYPDEN